MRFIVWIHIKNGTDYLTDGTLNRKGMNYSDDNSNAYVTMLPIVVFNNDIDLDPDIDYILLMGKIVVEDDMKYIEGIEVIDTMKTSFMFDIPAPQNPYFHLIFIGQILSFIGGVLLFFSYRAAKKKIITTELGIANIKSLKSNSGNNKVKNFNSKIITHNKRKRLFFLIILILFIAGIIFPVILLSYLPSLDKDQSTYYLEALEKHNVGDSVIIKDSVLDFKVESGKTYLIVKSAIDSPYGMDQWGESEDYFTIEFDQDLGDKLSQVVTQEILIYGTVVSVGQDSDGDVIKYIKGEEIILLENQNFTSGTIAFFSFNIILILVIIYLFFRLRFIKQIANEAKLSLGTPESSDFDVNDNEDDSIQTAILMRDVTCPKCRSAFKMAQDDDMVKCPHCGVAGVTKKD